MEGPSEHEILSEEQALGIKVWELGKTPKGNGVPQTSNQQFLGGEVIFPGEAL